MSTRGKRGSQPLTNEEIHALLSACTRGSLGDRNRAMIYVLWRCGLRISELCRLRPCDVDPIAGTIRILQSKRGRSRTVGVDGETCSLIALWAAKRTAQGVPGFRPLFCSLDGGALTPNGVRELLRRLKRKAKVIKPCRPNDFRSTFATVASRQIPITDLQWALGHSDLGTTQRYISNLGGASIDAVRAIKWG
jgi:integrase/recombinase XerD